uniref:serum response factor-like isoform X2 n=1 Tax=Myxine glutinosa TaxID=7769 RepID=UPI00358F32B1
MDGRAPNTAPPTFVQEFPRHAHPGIVKPEENLPSDESDDDSVESGEAVGLGLRCAALPRGRFDVSRGMTTTPGLKPGKKTRGRVKIKMEFIDNKLRRYTTFSKRKTGIMKKAYELSTLTGTQVMLLVASETGHVYTFATRKLQPMITSESGKALIQTCLNSPDSPPRPTGPDPSTEQRMSASGFEETELSYQIGDIEPAEDSKEALRPTLFTITNFSGPSNSPQPPSTPAVHRQCTGSSITAYSPPLSSVSSGCAGLGGIPAKSTTGLVPFPSSLALMSVRHLYISSQFGVRNAPAGGSVGSQLLTLPSSVGHVTLQAPTGHVTLQPSNSGHVTLPTVSHGHGGHPGSQPAGLEGGGLASCPVSSVPVAGHMVYPGPHSIMYAPSSLPEGELALLNAFHPLPSPMQLTQAHSSDQGSLQQLMFAGPGGPVHIPVQLQQIWQH